MAILSIVHLIWLTKFVLWSILNINNLTCHPEPFFFFFFSLLMAKNGRNLTVRRWHHLLMPESKGKLPLLLISRTLVWWMRTSAAAPYSFTQMALMQEIRYIFIVHLSPPLPIVVLQLHYVSLLCDKSALYCCSHLYIPWCQLKIVIGFVQMKNK